MQLYLIFPSFQSSEAHTHTHPYDRSSSERRTCSSSPHCTPSVEGYPYARCYELHTITGRLPYIPLQIVVVCCFVVEPDYDSLRTKDSILTLSKAPLIPGLMKSDRKTDMEKIRNLIKKGTDMLRSEWIFSSTIANNCWVPYHLFI